MNRLSGWDHARAVILAVVLAGQVVYALPLPPAVSASELRAPLRARELAAWRDALAGLGIDLSVDALARFTVTWSRRTSALHEALKAPFAPMFSVTGTNQAWALFAAATTTPDRLVVAIDDGRGGGWRVVSRRLDPRYPWLADPLRYRRIRGVWDAMPDRARPAYEGLTQWIARRAFDAFPEAARVRVTIERGTSVYPWLPADDAVTVRSERVIARPPP